MKKMLIFGIVSMLVLSGVAFLPLNSWAATPEDIEQAIDDGVAWLVGQQNGDGSWGAIWKVAETGFVLIKLQDRAYELGLDPFETDIGEPDYYEYAADVIDGWEYLFTPSGPNNGLYAFKQMISLQDHTGGASGTNDDPDARVNGYGITFGNIFGPFDSVYYTGVCLMALAASRTPGRLNDGGIDYDADGNVETFGEIAQDVVDWLAFAQGDSGNAEGGFYYDALDNSGSGADNSNSGYAYLGLAAAEGFGCTVPSWVKDELDVWIDFIQDDVTGGSAYATWNTGWVNLLKTGNLIFEMTFYGDTPAVTRFEDALDYIESHWQDANLDTGWIGDFGVDDDGDTLIDEDPKDGIDNDGDTLIDEDIGMSHFQAMYCLMKGLEYSGIHLIDTDGDSVRDDDWFNQEPAASPMQDFANVILAQQNLDGSWESSPCYVWPGGTWGTMSGQILSTVWALLTLEKITPPPPVKIVELIAGQYIDVGEIHIWHNDTLLFVKFITEGDWYLSLMHVHVAMDPDDIPQTKKGNPIPGQFDYHGVCDPPAQEFLFEIPWNSSWDPDLLCIAAHAEVVTLASDCVEIVSDTTTTFDGITSGNSGDAVLAWVHPNWNAQIDHSFSDAAWIWESYQVVHEVAGDVVDFFKTIFIPGLYPLDIDGELWITCDNGYELYLNDMVNYLGRFQLEDGWRASALTESFVHTAGWQSVEYYDISDYLVCGDNFFKFATANEYMGPDDGQSYGTKTSNPAGLIFEGTVCYTVVCQEETAWGEGEDFPGSSWGMYIVDP